MVKRTFSGPENRDGTSKSWDVDLDKDTVAVKGDVKGARWVQVESQTPHLLYAEALVAWFVEDVIGEAIQFPVTITSRPFGKSSLTKYGHFTLEPGWTTREGNPVWEIALVSEHLGDDPRQTVTTILHEAIHLVNFSRGTRDVAKSGRHNGEFAESAEGAGLVVEKHSKHGHVTPDISEELWDKVNKHCPLDASTFDLFKSAWSPKPTRQSTKAYECGCEFKVRIPAKQELDADCNVCGQHYELAE
jgi:hypothetical protein